MEHSHILSAVDNPERVSGMFWVKQKRHQLHKRIQLNYRAPSLCRRLQRCLCSGARKHRNTLPRKVCFDPNMKNTPTVLSMRVHVYIYILTFTIYIYTFIILYNIYIYTASSGRSTACQRKRGHLVVLATRSNPFHITAHKPTVVSRNQVAHGLPHKIFLCRIKMKSFCRRAPVAVCASTAPLWIDLRICRFPFDVLSWALAMTGDYDILSMRGD